MKNLHWMCPNCKSLVDFQSQVNEVFSEDNEADFCPESGLWIHTIECSCGTQWYMSISGMNKLEK